MKPVVFWGATGQARVLREALDPAEYEVVALFDRDVRLESPFPGVPLYRGEDGFLEWLAGVSQPSRVYAAAAIGGAAGVDRLRRQRQFSEAGLAILTIVHPRGFVARDAVLGPGCQVLAQAAVASCASIGPCGIVNTGATVDHECVLGAGVHVCPGAHLAGSVEVGDFAMIGTGATVLPRVKIGANAIVGAGAVVVRDVAPRTVVVGTPARLLTKGK